MPSSNQALPVAVIGAGPVGLAAAAHLEERGVPFLVLEASQDVAASFASVAHVRLFSTWKLDVDAAAARLLEAEGWQRPPDEELPTRAPCRRYLNRSRPTSTAGSATAHGRRAHAPRVRHVKTPAAKPRPFVCGSRRRAAGGAPCTRRDRCHRHGSPPNPLGASGLSAIGEAEHAAHIAYGMPDVLGAARARYAGKRVAVVGAATRRQARCCPAELRRATRAPHRLVVRGTTSSACSEAGQTTAGRRAGRSARPCERSRKQGSSRGIPASSSTRWSATAPS